jgi:nucleotide sugar dehydrogenase
MFADIQQKKAPIALVGLGYVGLPIALAFAKKTRVIGYEIHPERLSLLRQALDPSRELPSEAFENADICFTDNPNTLAQARFYIVAVPTPVDSFNKPDLSALLSATEQVGKVLKKGDYVVYESTVYPGCTEEECQPILERLSGLRCGQDFKIGYSPERINPGDKVHTMENTVKIVSGCDDEALDQIARVYELVIRAGVHRAPSLKVAEAAKVIENTQRDVNIALMNELSIIFGRMGINTYDVLEAAGTKWNFLNFTPGLVGGHCIGVDPYYLVHKAHALKYHTQLISAGRYVNDTMGNYLAKKLVKRIIATGVNILETKVLVMGATYKEDVSDIRNSRAMDIVRELRDYGIQVTLIDPYADPKEVEETYNISLSSVPEGPYQAIVLAVPHSPYTQLDEAYFTNLSTARGVLLDIKGIYRKQIKKLEYFSL